MFSVLIPQWSIAKAATKMTKGFCLVIVYAWVEFGYLRQTEQFDDDEGIVDKLAMSTQSCILDQTPRVDCQVVVNYHAS